MLSRKLRSPFSLYKKKTPAGIVVWYARFWDFDTKSYAVTRSTGVEAVGKRERRADADKVARELLPEIKFAPKTRATKFLAYVEAFWQPDSPYALDRETIDKKPLSHDYVKNSRETFLLHAGSFAGFKNLNLSELNQALINDWMRDRLRAGVSARRVGAALQAMRIAVRYAVGREELEKDPFARVSAPRSESRERGILTAPELIRLRDWKPKDPRVRLVVLLESCLAMRRGEVRGLLWGDLRPETSEIHVQHNYVNGDGLKAPKNRSSRKNPYPEVIREAVEAVRAVSPYVGPSDFIVFGLVERGQPVTTEFMRLTFEQAMAAIGISPEEKRRRNLTPHGLRHTFITHGRIFGLSEIEILAIAGHKSTKMMDHYTHFNQAIDFRDTTRRLDDGFLKPTLEAPTAASRATPHGDQLKAVP